MSQGDRPRLSGPVRSRSGVRFVVSSPASSANLGSGFDTMGMALDLRLLGWVMEEAPQPPGWAPDGWEAGLSRLAEQAAEAVFEEVDRRPDVPFHLLLETPFPAGRGMGSSAAAQAVGLVAANRLLGDPLGTEAVFDLLAALEGHADNAAPALYGGLNWVWQEGHHFGHAMLPPPPLEVALAIPARGLTTSRSRHRLPKVVPIADAVHNLQRAGLWLLAAQNGRWDLLWQAADDRLHQPQRARLMPYLEASIAAARTAGAYFAALSGSGSSVVALSDPGLGLTVAQAMVSAMGQHGVEAAPRRVRPTTRGTEVYTPERIPVPVEAAR